VFTFFIRAQRALDNCQGVFNIQGDDPTSAEQNALAAMRDGSVPVCWSQVPEIEVQDMGAEEDFYVMDCICLDKPSESDPYPTPVGGGEPAPAPELEPVPEPTPAPAPDPIPEPAPEPVPEVVPDPTPAPSEEPVVSARGRRGLSSHPDPWGPHWGFPLGSLGHLVGWARDLGLP
jgi:hypothetical protein